MPDTITAETVQIAEALIDEIDAGEAEFLTPEQQRAFHSINDIADPEAKAARCLELSGQLTALANAAVESRADIQRQAAESTERSRFSPEASEVLKQSLTRFESQLRTESQAMVKRLSPSSKHTGPRRSRIRI